MSQFNLWKLRQRKNSWKQSIEMMCYLERNIDSNDRLFHTWKQRWQEERYNIPYMKEKLCQAYILYVL